MASMFDDLIPNGEPAAGGAAAARPMGGDPLRLTIVKNPGAVAQPDEQREPAVAAPALSDRDRMLIIRTVLGEAAGEGDDGQRAVAGVILNRLRSGEFGASVPQVVGAKNQFEPWMTPEGRRRMLAYSEDGPEYTRAAKNLDALLGGADPTQGATHFYAPKAQAALGRAAPKWADGQEPIVIGNHNFYSLGAQGQPKVRLASADNKASVATSSAPAIDFSDLVPSETDAAQPSEQPTDGGARFQDRFSGDGMGVPAADAEKLSSGLRTAADKKIATDDLDGAIETFVAEAINTLGMNAPRNIKAWVEARKSGKPFEQVYDELKSKEEAGARLNPKASIAGTAAGAVTGMLALPEVKAVLGATIGGRALNAAATGAAYGVTSELLDSKDPVKASVAAALGGALGGVAAPVAERIVGLISKMVAAGKTAATFLKADGTLSDDAAAAAREAGIDPETLQKVMQKKYAEAFSKKGATPATARETAADEFGIKLTPGEAASDYGKIAVEQGMARDAKGPLAGKVARDFYEAREGQIGKAKEGIQDRVTQSPAMKEFQEIIDAAPPGPLKDRAQATLDKAKPATVESVNDAANTVAQGARGKAREAKAGYNAAYDDALGRDGEFGDMAFVDIGERIRRNALKSDSPVVINPRTTPVAASAIDHLDANIGKLRIVDKAEPRSRTPQTAGTHQWPGEPTRVAGETIGPGTIAGVNLKGVEQARKELVSFYKSAKASGNAEDARAMRRIIAGFDDELETAMAVGLFRGDDQALPALKRARAMFADYQKTFRSQGGGDSVGRAMEKIVERDATGADVANMLYGKAAIGEKGDSVRLAGRLKQLFGPNSEEWSAVRQGLWLRLTSQPEGVTDFGPQALSTRISKFLSGDGADMAKVIFTPQELAEMRRFATTMKSIVPPTGTVNHSNTAYTLMREAAIGSGLGFGSLMITQDPAVAVALTGARIGGKLSREAYRGARAKRYFSSGAPAERPSVPRGVSSRVGVGAGELAGQAQ